MAQQLARRQSFSATSKQGAVAQHVIVDQFADQAKAQRGLAVVGSTKTRPLPLYSFILSVYSFFDNT